MKFTFIFFGAALLLFSFFYFYPALIFEAKITGIGSELIADLSLRNILFKENLPEQLNAQNINSIRPTVAGGLIMFICFLALPLMIAYRFTIPKKEEGNTSESNQKN